MVKNISIGPTHTGGPPLEHIKAVLVATVVEVVCVVIFYFGKKWGT